MFVDNCTSNYEVNLSNIKTVFLPKNTTSIIQSLDQGVIKAFKGYYRRNLVNYFINQLENSPSNQNLIKDPLMKFRYWTMSAWDQGKPICISNCFKKAGFRSDLQESLNQS